MLSDRKPYNLRREHRLAAGAASVRYPDQPTWICDSRRASYREPAARVARLAAGLRDQFQRRSRIVLVLSNGPEFCAALWAGCWAGLVVAPVNRHLHAREIGYVARPSGASPVIYDEHTRDAVRAAGVEAALADASANGKPLKRVLRDQAAR